LNPQQQQHPKPPRKICPALKDKGTPC
jgi:hypothetical protein